VRRTLAQRVSAGSTDQLMLGTRDAEQVDGAEIFGRISKPSGWVVETFERTRSLNEPAQPAPNPEIVALQPGPYRLTIAVKDLASDMVACSIPPSTFLAMKIQTKRSSRIQPARHQLLRQRIIALVRPLSAIRRSETDPAQVFRRPVSAFQPILRRRELSREYLHLRAYSCRL
jgi:hypothetical protein